MKKFDNYSFYFNYSDRFKEDKLFFENDNHIFAIDGVLLNKKELYDQYNVNNMKDLISIIYNKFHKDFIKYLRGPFLGFVMNKNQNELFVFSNQTGDTHVFYYINKNQAFISNDFNKIVSGLKENNIDYSLDEIAVNQILSFGYLVTENTLIKNIKRLTPGNILILQNHKIINKEYYKLNNTNNIDISFDEAIEVLDEKFRNATTRCFEKDLEYGYNSHLADISGGLDSRMVNWVAKDLGYDDITNISYSQSMSHEHKYSSEITNYMENQFIHKQLDEGEFLLNPENIIKKNYCLASYQGITGGDHLLKSINFNEYGLEHTGQLGDVVIGSYVSDSEHRAVDHSGYRSNSTIEEQGLGIDFNDFDNHEMYIFLTRGMQGILSTHTIRRNYTQAVSPFLDLDFMNFCFSLPLKYRINHKLYLGWISEKYPDALNVKCTTSKTEYFFEKAMEFGELAYHRLFYEIKLLLYNNNLINKFNPPKNKMNPFKYWYNTNNGFKEFVENYFNKNIKLIKNSKIKKRLIKQFDSDNISIKLSIISILAFYKLYFKN